jgi:cellulose synthase (UDP-forming)
VTKTNKRLLAFHIFMTALYFFVIAFLMPIGNRILFGLLIAGEVFHVFQMLMYIFTVWDTEYKAKMDDNFTPPVDVFVTVAGEPVDILRQTITAIKAMDYPAFETYILNDGFVAHKENWREVESLARELGVHCLTRTLSGGAKAGNINNGLRQTRNPYVAMFDADHVPHPDFLRKTIPYFVDPKMGFVQSPQFYKNHSTNLVTRSAWDQQELFFGPICKGKNRLNSVTMCGTNMVISRKAIIEAGGMCEKSIAEDFLTGIFIHSNGWKSTYVPEVIAEGLAPEDFLSYFKQQLRWARGALDALFKYNLLFRKGLTLSQRLQYLSSTLFFVSGLVVLMNALMPVVFMYTGLVPLQVSGMLLALIFLPYIFLTVYILQLSTNFSFTFSSIAFSMSGFNIHLKAIWSALTNKKSKFEITSKTKVSGTFSNLVVPQMLYVLVALFGVYFAFMREGLTGAFISNTAWVSFNIAIFAPFIAAALSRSQKATEPKKIFIQKKQATLSPVGL